MPVLATPGSSQPTDCKHAFYAGVHYSPGSQCVEALATNDVRCYDRTPHDDCTYGLPGGNTFVVPSYQACQQYDTAYKKTQTPAMLRRQVQQHVSSYVLKQAVQKMHVRLLIKAGYFEVARRSNATGEMLFPADTEWQARMGDATRDLIAQGLTDLEADGLEKLETGACDVFSGGAGAPFCSMLFDNPIASWINNEIVNIPIVHKFTYWLADTCSDLIPGGARNLMNDVVDTYNDVKRAIKPITDLWSDVTSVASKVSDTLFGWL